MWDGVRNHSAKLNMMAMKVGDEALFYHSNIGKECVGIMRITEESRPIRPPRKDRRGSSCASRPCARSRIR